MHLLGGLASVEVEVNEGGEQGGGDQKQQRLQQTILHFLPNQSLDGFLFKPESRDRQR